MTVHEPAGQFEVLLQAPRRHVETADDAPKSFQHVMGQMKGVGPNEPFGAGMADVAFVPKGDVFLRHDRKGAQHARHAADFLALDGVALVRHRRRTFLFLAERFERFAHFGALQVADFGGDPFHRAAKAGQGEHDDGVAVSLDDLRRNEIRLQPQLGADGSFDVRRCPGIPIYQGKE